MPPLPLTPLTVGNSAAFLVILTITVTYLIRARWQRSSVGRSLMGFLVCVGTLTFAGLLRRVFGLSVVAEQVATVGFWLVVIVGVVFERRLLLELRREQVTES